MLRAGGGTGLATAAIALYGSFAGVVNNTWGRHLIPTFPEPGRRLAHLARRKKRPHSVTSSAGEREIARAES